MCLCVRSGVCYVIKARTISTLVGFIVNAQTDPCLGGVLFCFLICFVVTESPHVGPSLHFGPDGSFGGHIQVELEA